MQNHKKIIYQEVDKFVDSLSDKKLLEFLTEDLKVINSLVKSEENYFNKNNQISYELWNNFVETLKKLTDNSERFQQCCKESNCKLYSVKMYSKIPFSIAEEAEEVLKYELKKYYSQLDTKDSEEYIDTFFKLPFEFTSLVVRYLQNILYKEKKALLTPKMETAKEYFATAEKSKNKFIININKVSLGESKNIPFDDLQLLLDIKAFYEYNPINIGTCEYVIRLLNNKKSYSNLEEMYGEKRLLHIKEQILTLPSYIQYLEDIKEGKESPYFTSSGLQNKEKENTFDDYVQKYFFPNNYIPNPKEDNTPEEPTTETPAATEQPAGLSTEQPTPEDLTGKKPEEPITPVP